MVQFDEGESQRKIKELRLEEEERLAQILSKRYGVGYINLSDVPVDSDAVKVIEEKEARERSMAGFARVDKRLKVAVLSPRSDKVLEKLEELKGAGYAPEVYMVSKRSLNKILDRYKDVSFSTETRAGVLEVSNDEIQKSVDSLKSLEEVKKLIEEILSLKKSYKISRIVETILAGALAIDASDVHIEPEEEYVRLRFRLNGILTEVIRFDKETYELLLSRIKLLSGLKLNVKEEAQDGRFSIEIGNQEIEIRSSSVPGAYGESIVMRVLNPESINVPMEELGMDPDLLVIMEREIRRPNGMILNTGPTGSGKTTTLYAFLRKVHTPEIKIITIEDPVEYHLPGIVQTQADRAKKYNFATGLRAALRQDPDVIMVGEVRDAETASIAVNSALTGHLVFSTLHTNSASGTFPRLIDLGIDPKILGSAINVAMAQRLVRVLCGACRKKVPLEGEAKVFIENTISEIPEKKRPPVGDFIWEASGCKECNNTGYKGRVGVFEAIVVNEEIGRLLGTNPREREIVETAASQGILNMKEDGVLKVLSGITTMAELERVIEVL